MKVCTCFILFGIFAHTNSTTRNRAKVHHRSVNLAHKIVSELSSEEYSNLHHFIAKETTASDKNKNKKHGFRAVRTKTLTDFVQDAINILNTYEETAFEDFFHILDNEIRKYHYEDCRFSELTQNLDTRSFLAGVIKKIREKSVSFIKAKINKIADMMRDETYGDDVKELLDYINTLYRHTEQMFHRILKETKHYRKTKSIKAHKNLIKVIRRGVQDILFDHYTALDSNTRHELKARIETFWKQFKRNSSSSADGNDAVSKSVISSIKVNENIMDEDNDPDHYSKNNPQTNLRNKRGRKNKEKYYQQPQDKETEKDDSSNESEKWNSDTDTPEDISSGQSFDSSSNSIKQSQKRHVEYKTERYMTLYTERISYESRTRPRVPRRPTTMSALRYSSEDESVGSKKVDVLRSNQNIKQSISYSNHDTKSVKLKPESRKTQNNKRRKSKSSTHENVHVIGEYNAVIDVQLANSLLKSLGLFHPVTDNQYDTISYQRSVEQSKSVPTRPTIQFRRMRAGAGTIAMKPALTKPPSVYSETQESINLNRLSNTRRNQLTILPEDDNFIRKQKQNFLARHNANDTGFNVPKNFNEYVIKRLDTLERDLKDFKSMLCDNHTHEVEVSNVTDNYEAKNESKIKDMKYNVVRLKIENHDLNKKEFNKENNDGHSTRSNIMKTESSPNNISSNPNVTKENTLDTTVIDTKNTPQFTSNNLKDNKKLNKDKIDNSETTVAVNGLVKVTDSTEFKPFETTPATTRIKPTRVDFSNLRYQLAHLNDGMDLRM